MELNAKILIVDDDKINSDMLAKRLVKRGFDVDVVSSGFEALEYLKTTRPQIVLLDILMPDMSGIEVLIEIRKKYLPLELSVIMVTAKSEANDIVEALKLGASDFINKPVNIEIVAARIQTQLLVLTSHIAGVERGELEALNTMIATYNHEINNPLTIALGFLWKLRKTNDSQNLVEIEEALNRISTIVKKIDLLTSGRIVKDRYSLKDNLFKLK